MERSEGNNVLMKGKTFLVDFLDRETATEK